MINATDTTAPVGLHTIWCDPIEHAHAQADVFDPINCVGKFYEVPFEGDVLNGWWTADDEDEPRFIVWGLGRDDVYLSPAGMRSALELLTALSDHPVAQVLRDTLVRALTDVEQGIDSGMQE